MRRTVVIWVIAGALVAACVVWTARHTYWADVKVPTPLRGEARTNQFYAAERFVEALGARARRDRVLALPTADAVIVVSGWNWSLTTERRIALEHWVEAGGRLVADETLLGIGDFERWSGIARDTTRDETDCDCEPASPIAAKPEDDCAVLTEENGEPARAPEYRVCESFRVPLTTRKKAAWALRDTSGVHAVRVSIGRGSVTVIDGTPFLHRDLFDGDHGRLFVASTELRPRDEVHFLSDDDHPSLLAWLWRGGEPLVLLALASVALVLWRGGVRFGPLMAPEPAARRSLAEQIRGTGQFALRHGRGAPLHSACMRALDEAAIRRINGYSTLARTERAAAIAQLTGFNPNALTTAMYHPPLHRSHELRRTLALVETARRAILLQQTGSRHGKH